MLPRWPDVAAFTVTMIDSLPNSFTYRIAHERGMSDRRLRELVAEGAIDRLGHGLYRKADAPPADLDRVELALRAPEATLCLTSALSHHDLTDTIPSVINAALPRDQRPPGLNAPVRWHRFDARTFHLGRETLQVEQGIALGIYSAERSIVDAFRLRHQEGDELALDGALAKRHESTRELSQHRHPRLDLALVTVNYLKHHPAGCVAAALDHHRPAFALVGVLLAIAAFDDTWLRPALLLAVVSKVSFLALFSMTRPHAAPMRRVAVADVAALAVLALVVALHTR